MVKVIMHGCNGKMGQVITGIIAEDKDAEIVAVVNSIAGFVNAVILPALSMAAIQTAVFLLGYNEK